MPAPFAFGGGTQLKIDGSTDAATYPNGVILDKTVRVRVWMTNAQGVRMGNPVYDDNTTPVGAALKTWTGTTKKMGGFPVGFYSVQVDVLKFKPDATTDPRAAVFALPVEVK